MAVSSADAAQWVKLQSKDVIIYSDASSREVVDFAVGYSAFRHAYKTMLAPVQPPAPAVVLLFRRLEDLQEHLPASRREGMQMVSHGTEVDGTALLSISLDRSRDRAMQQAIQFDTIFMLGRTGNYMPLWMSQGAGEVLEGLRVKKASYVVGAGESGYEDRWQFGSNLPWSRFFDVTTESPEYSGTKSEGMFHAKAWALMHRVLLGGSDGASTFQTMLAKAQSMRDLEAVEATLGISIGSLEKEVHRHIMRSKGREIPFDVAGLRKSLTTAPADMSEVHLQISNLLFSTGKADAAEVELLRAYALAPDSPAVIEARARSAMRAGESGDAVRRYRDAIQKGSRNPMAYIRSAEERLDGVSPGRMDRPGAGAFAAVESLAEARKALEIDPTNGRAYALLGRSLYLLPDLKPEHIEEISRGVARGWNGQRVRYFRALLHQRLGNEAGYMEDLKAIRDDPLATSSLRTLASESLDKAQTEPVVAATEKLVKERKYDEARAHVKNAMVEAVATTVGERFGRLLAWVDETQAYDDLRDAFLSRRWPEVTEQGKKFLDQYPNTSMRTAVRRMIDQATRSALQNAK